MPYNLLLIIYQTSLLIWPQHYEQSVNKFLFYVICCFLSLTTSCNKVNCSKYFSDYIKCLCIIYTVIVNNRHLIEREILEIITGLTIYIVVMRKVMKNSDL